MKEVYFTNTLAGSLEKFEPLHPPKVGLYVCGLTPYDHAHLGHARCYVAFDIVRRTLEAAGFRVTHIQNFTDMDDKIINRAKELGVSPFVLASRYIEEYFQVAEPLNILHAHYYPRVTEHIPEIIAVIKRLIERGAAYIAQNGDVYYSVAHFEGYGKLSKRKTEELVSGARVEVSPHKKDPLDFALWKSAGDAPGTVPEGGPSLVLGASPAAESISWDSPWSKGRPGWHIECSVMSTKYLGQPFDIHGGGQDLIFPHHENEIAQSEAAAGKIFVKYFLHNGFVTINREKMSKSLGNFFTLEEILAKYPAMVVRYYLISEHYRSPLDFSDKALEEAQSALARVQEAVDLLLFVANTRSEVRGQRSVNSELYCDVLSALSNDFHTPEALAALQSWASAVFEDFRAKKLTASKAKTELAQVLSTVEKLLGLKLRWSLPDVPAEARSLIKKRELCRKKKDFSSADQIREQLREKLSLIVEDTPYGPRPKFSNLR